MSIDKSKFPENLEERIEYVKKKISLYELIWINGFRTNCSIVYHDINKSMNEKDFKQTMSKLYEKIINPYKSLELSVLDDNLEFSFVYTTKDIIEHLEEWYNHYDTLSSAMKKQAKEIIKKDTFTLLGIGTVCERNIRIYDRELLKCKNNHIES